MKFHLRVGAAEEDKVLCTANLLAGAAFEWFEPRLRNYLEYKDKDNRDDETNYAFGYYDNFLRELKKVFGDVDEQKTVERKLIQLRQIGSAKQYTSEFR